MVQDISRRWQDEPEAKNIENYPNPEDVPRDLKDRLAVELLVKAQCPDCHFDDFYYSSESRQTIECNGVDCDCEFLLP